jgi:hypothetical protein
VLCGVLFVLYTGIRWEYLPQKPGFGSELRAANLLDFPVPQSSPVTFGR